MTQDENISFVYVGGGGEGGKWGRFHAHHDLGRTYFGELDML